MVPCIEFVQPPNLACRLQRGFIRSPCKKEGNHGQINSTFSTTMDPRRGVS
ncbi:hypothetical protein SMAC4_14056 [Sordaria macrospora]|uniref:uncharacterized protein n=1 Tax=Sordaria macrospora TaxID=5147 RepID=UPI002B2DC35F|nr:hypothetical protein SMAC4_14056 [Sordaria macrospora]